MGVERALFVVLVYLGRGLYFVLVVSLRVVDLLVENYNVLFSSDVVVQLCCGFSWYVLECCLSSGDARLRWPLTEDLDIRGGFSNIRGLTKGMLRRRSWETRPLRRNRMGRRDTESPFK